MDTTFGGARRGAPVVLAGALWLGCAPSPAATPNTAGPRPQQWMASPGLQIQRACTPTGAELCFNARDDNCNGVIDEGCGVRTGLVQFVIAWDAPRADVDLNVTDPEGELVEVGAPSQSGLVKEKDCPGRDGTCYGQNMENVYLEDDKAPRGKYQVQVRLEKLGGETPPIAVTLGARVGPRTYALEFELQQPADERKLSLVL